VASAAVTDRRWIARGEDRTSAYRFALLLAPWALLLAFGLYAAALCLRYGLNQTNMDNRFAFGLWIFVDLTIIALGAGAFLYFTGQSEPAAQSGSWQVVPVLGGLSGSTGSGPGIVVDGTF